MARGIDAGELSHCFPHGVLQRAAVLHVFFHQVGDNFSICFGDELVAFLFQAGASARRNFPQCRYGRRRSGRCNPGGDAHSLRLDVHAWPSACGRCRTRRRWGLPDYFLKIVKFSRCAPDFHFAVRADNGDSCGIIAAIFQPPQAVEDERNDFLGADISDDSTHCFLSERGARHRKGRPALKE